MERCGSIMRCFSRDRLTHLAGRDTLPRTHIHVHVFKMGSGQPLPFQFSLPSQLPFSFPFPTLYRVLVPEEGHDQRKDVIRGKSATCGVFSKEAGP